MNKVVALGRHAGPYLDRTTHVVHVDPDSVLGDLSAMQAMVQAQLDLQGSIVVVYPSGLGDQPARMLHTVRTALDGPPVLWHATTLPPLAADVLVTLAGALGETAEGASVVTAALSVLERQLVHLTWVPSVAGLTDPAPTVAQHARSVLPHTSWLVSSWPEPAIWRRDGEEAPPMPQPTQPVGAVVADLAGDTGWIKPTVLDHFPGIQAIQVDPPADSPSWWGCRRVTQVVVYPRSVDQMSAALDARLDPGECRWCRRLSGEAICPWCHLPRSGVTRLETPHEDDLALFGPNDAPQEEVAAT